MRIACQPAPVQCQIFESTNEVLHVRSVYGRAPLPEKMYSVLLSATIYLERIFQLEGASSTVDQCITT